MVSVIGNLPSFLNDSDRLSTTLRRTCEGPTSLRDPTDQLSGTHSRARRLPLSRPNVNNFRGFLAIGEVVCQYEHPTELDDS
jgi:hypothetical protein